MENALKQLRKMIATPSRSETVVRLLVFSRVPFGSSFNPKGAPRRSRLTEVLLGMTMPSRCTLAHDISFFDDSLNESQMAAVRFALESVEVACIHGPPGEGVLVKPRVCLPTPLCRYRKNSHTHRDYTATHCYHSCQSQAAALAGLWGIESVRR